jgi:glycosyltransferase involved in cell wall biosynthesis
VNPLRVAFFTITRSGVVGADRDWISTFNALGPKRIDVFWAGLENSRAAADLCAPGVCSRVIDLNIWKFAYGVFEQAEIPRTTTEWIRIWGAYLREAIRSARLLRSVIDPANIDIVISHTAVNLVGSIFALRYRRPHVWSVKECLDLRYKPARAVARWIGWTSKQILVPSCAVASAFGSKARILPDGNPIQEIRNAAARTSRAALLQELELPASVPLLAQVGAIPLKGLHILSEALVRLAQRLGPATPSVVFYGVPANDYRERILAIVAPLPAALRERVRFSSFAPNDYGKIAAADVVAHPSVRPDSYPNAIREAMILGRPVVASRIGGIPEMISDAKTGFLVEPSCANSLAATLEKLCASPALRQEIGAAARQYAETTFDVRNTAEKFMHALNTAAGTDGRTPNTHGL